MKVKGGSVYIMTNRKFGVLYIGVTADLVRRVAEHKIGEVAGFTKRYGLRLLVYSEQHEDIVLAISREKQLKEWKRAWKIRLIEKINPEWDDLYGSIL